MHAPNMQSSAMSDLDLAIRILEAGADYSWYARVALVSGNLTSLLGLCI